MKKGAFTKTPPAAQDANSAEGLRRSTYAPAAFRLLRAAAIVCAAFLANSAPTSAQIVTATDGPGGSPTAVAVNPATNKIYVANELGQNILVIDGATNSSTVINTPGSSPTAITVNPITNTIYAVNQNNNTVTVINGATNAISSVNAGGSPFAVAVNPVTNTIYVASQCDPSAAPLCGNGLITIINGADNSTTAFTAGPAGDSALALAANPVTNKIYVAESRGNNVAVIDGASNTITTTATGNFPVAVAVNPVTNKIYAVNQTDGTVTVIDGASNTVTSTITVGTQPSAVAVNSVTNKIYVANAGSNSVTVIDGATSTTTTTVSVGLGPRNVQVNSATNQVYVADYTGGAVTVIDGGTNTVTATLSTGTLAIAEAVNPVTGKVYIANNGGNDVTVVDGATNATNTITAGSTPNALAVDPVSNRVYVANGSSNNVSVIDRNANTTTTLAVGNNPAAVAVYPSSSKVYVANQGDGTVTVIDETTNAATTVTVGIQPAAVAMNPVTNQIYVANHGSANVTVIDGNSSATSTVAVGNNPAAVAVNPVTNQIYVANSGDGTITVIDGASHNTSTVSVGSTPSALAVNLLTNQIYVANQSSNNVTVIDGATNSATATVAVGMQPFALDVNPVANEIYVANQGDNTVTVIEGATNNTTTDLVGLHPYAVAVDSVTNRVYVSNNGASTVTMIEGAPDPSNGATVNNRSTATITVGNSPTAVVVNPETGEVFVANNGAGTVTLIDEQNVQAIPLKAAVTPLPGNETGSLSPAFSFAASSSFAPTAPAVDALFYQVDTWQGAWLPGTNLGAGNFGGTTPTLQQGFHILYFYATDGEETESTNSGSPLVGNIGAYGFLVANLSATNTALSVDVNPSMFGATVNLAAAVTTVPTSATIPTGAVTFLDGTSPLGTVTLDPTGSATLPVSSLTVGSHSITAAYTPGAGFTASTSALLTQTVNQGSSSATVTASPTPGIVGQLVTLTATVSASAPATGTPTGTVTFMDGAANIGTGTLNSGQASVNISSLPQGSHSISVVYSGDSNFLGSTSATLSLPIKQTTTIALTASPNPSNTGQPLTLTATISVPAGTTGAPGGSVTFLDGSNTLGTAPVSAGTATFSTTSLTVGTHSLTASYSGDSNFASNTSAAVTQTVNLLIAITESVHVSDTPALLPSAMINVPEAISVSDAPAVLLAAQVNVGEQITVTDAPTVLVAAQVNVGEQITVMDLPAVGNTPMGPRIVAVPIDTTTGKTPASVTFTNVTVAGVTSLTTSSVGAPAPAGFQPGVPPVYYDISTTATFTPPATVCINYAGIVFANPAGPHVFHLENGVWVDHTTSVDTTNLVACGTVSSFSPFALFAPQVRLTITANPAVRQYGSADPSFTVSYAGFVNGDGPASLSGQLTCSGADTPSSPVGSYAINCSGLISSFYAITFVPDTLIITPAALTIAANNAVRVYGSANPIFTASYAGFANGDSASVLIGALSCSAAATPASPVGIYPVICSGQSAANYSIIYLPGQLAVTPAMLTITANNLTKNFDAPNPTLTWTASGFVNGDSTSVLTTLPTCTTTATTTSPVGIYPITCSGAATANYTFSYVPGTLTVACHYVSIGLSPSTVSEGGLITVSWTLRSCANAAQTVAFDFTLSGPSQPNSCSTTKSEMFAAPPLPLQPNTLQTLSFPFRIPKGICPGTYSTTVTTTINGQTVDTSSTSLTIKAP
jgi:YVTN family beta-propeller protein